MDVQVEEVSSATRGGEVVTTTPVLGDRRSVRGRSGRDPSTYRVCREEGRSYTRNGSCLPPPASLRAPVLLWSHRNVSALVESHPEGGTYDVRDPGVGNPGFASLSGLWKGSTGSGATWSRQSLECLRTSIGSADSVLSPAESTGGTSETEDGGSRRSVWSIRH